jgi:intracellular sulfur oxidation DsrE/DsrF family protein
MATLAKRLRLAYALRERDDAATLTGNSETRGGSTVDKKVVVLVRQEGLGQVAPQDRRFSLEMLDRFFHTLESQPIRPEAICFYTDGVKVLCEGSHLVPGLQILEGLGVRLVACKSCLEYFHLADKLAVGKVGGMNDIVKLLLEADHVITV